MDIPGSLSEDELRQVLTDAVRLDAARVEETGTLPQPIDLRRLTATDVVVVICQMMRAVDINMFDLNMWYGRVR